MEYEHIIQPFEPVIYPDSRVLILGSLPSVLSRKAGFYYGNPRNRLWSVLAGLYGEALPVNTDEKRALLKRHGLAMWDVIHQCDIRGSGDASIKNAVPADIAALVKGTGICRIVLNGSTAGRLFMKYQSAGVDLPVTVLPSTSPANASYSLTRLLEAWKVILEEV